MYFYVDVVRSTATHPLSLLLIHLQPRAKLEYESSFLERIVICSFLDHPAATLAFVSSPLLLFCSFSSCLIMLLQPAAATDETLNNIQCEVHTLFCSNRGRVIIALAHSLVFSWVLYSSLDPEKYLFPMMPDRVNKHKQRWWIVHVWYFCFFSTNFPSGHNRTTTYSVVCEFFHNRK